MSSITERKNSDGSVSHVAQVRVRPFRPAHKFFNDRDCPNRKDARKVALAWAEELRLTQREQGGRGADARTWGA
jgi:hypothetical protein